MMNEWGDTYERLTQRTAVRHKNTLSRGERVESAIQAMQDEATRDRRPYAGNPMTREEYRRVYGI